MFWSFIVVVRYTTINFSQSLMLAPNMLCMLLVIIIIIVVTLQSVM